MKDDPTRWAFLAPWLDILRPYAFVTPTTRRSTIHPDEIDSIVDHVACVGIRFRDVEVLESRTLPDDADEATIVARELEEKQLEEARRAANVLTTAQLRSLRDAMEIVGRALRLAPHVWAAFPNEAWTSTQAACKRVAPKVQPRAFRDDDLEATFELVYEYGSVEFKTWLVYLEELLAPMETEMPHADVRDARQQLAQLDSTVGASVQRYPVDVSLRVSLASTAMLVGLVTTLEIVCCRAGSAGNSAARFRVAHCSFRVAEIDAVVVESLIRVRALGIDICELATPTSRATSSTHDALATLAEPTQTTALGRRRSHSFQCHLLREFAAPSLVYSVLLNPTCPSTVKVDGRFVPVNFDWLLFCRVLQASFGHSRPRRRFHFQWPNLDASFVVGLQAALDTIQATRSSRCEAQLDPNTALGKSLLTEHDIPDGTLLPAICGRDDATICVGPSNSWVQVPNEIFRGSQKPEAAEVSPPNNSGTASVSISIGRCDAEALETVMTWLFVCTPMAYITSLDLQVVLGTDFTCEKVRQILGMCPRLRSLQLSHSEALVMDAVLDGYRDGSCRLEVLSIDVCGVVYLPLIKELAMPQSLASQTLREVQTGFPQHNEDEFLHALTVMLASNHKLEFVEVVLTGSTIGRADWIATALHRFHREPLAVASRSHMPLRTKLAFLSGALGCLSLDREADVAIKRTHAGVLVSNKRGWNFDPSLLASILSFAAPCLDRLVHLKTRTRCHYDRGCAGRVANYRKSVCESMIEL